jgi:integrase/recombinase XerC
MPSGSGVVRYEGKRGIVWRIKFRDASGRQVMETLGAERDGWTRRKAEAELRERIVRAEKRGWRKPTPLTFREYAGTWFSEGKTRRGWKPSTVAQYRSVHDRLVDGLGRYPLQAIRPRHVAEYVAAISKNYAAATVSRDVSTLHAIFETARKEELVETNPATRAERPKIKRHRWRILEPAEVARVARGFTDAQARTVFLVLVQLGLRRSELQRLRWRDVDLLENVLRVRESKSEDGIRAIAIPSGLAEALWQHRRASAYQGDDDLVFSHPTKGTEYHAKTFRSALSAALAAAGVEGHLRPFHDLRHASLTNGAAAGESPIALMTRAGHADMRTTQTYLHLAGVVFRDEAAELERRLLGSAQRGTSPATGTSTPGVAGTDMIVLPVERRT